MKKSFFKFASGIIVALCFFNASYTVDAKEISNPKEWVSEHKDEIAKMNRADWLKLDDSVSRAVLNAFTPEQKWAFWKDKFEETMQLDWSVAERQHIQALIDWLESDHDIFSGDPSNLNKVNEFCTQWMNDGIKQLGWTKGLAYSILAYGNKLLNKNGEIVPLKGQSCLIKQK